MAIHTTPSSPPSGGVALDIQAWTEQAAASLSNLNLSAPTFVAQPISHHAERHGPSPAVRGTSIALDIPLDTPQDARVDSTYRRREPQRRDSMERREALLKGKEGSRRRRRWENDRLLGNPYRVPPTSADWEVRPPTHRTPVPYYLAPLWDNGLAAHAAARRERKVKSTSQHKQAVKGVPEGASRVPKEFKEKMKKSKGARGLLQDLETEVRGFVAKCQENDEEAVTDSEEDEVVFVGRDGEMQDRTWRSLEREYLLFQSAADDQGAAFCRYLVHQIGCYYGLKTWSVTTGNPARREAYVGFDMQTGHDFAVQEQLPRPLYGLV
ncbi:hypothetical protein EJ05DRAFT_26045 [Pseudovirgaria hyperparasitica]|uniref:R3H-associated N-terminal domain-containing protein n=1 Tax=Pseudovirgaria hyperparasitica TaxID=470096 RepID=A0A6A6WLT3_9PEZI|nr:uncharacterized protein EJ05DRAFT_26045 [Pseudovirgaria hyperparasitica]KAF2763106.1 hypothetical protein EJ05DRAFT_26045 [Pseudovirgaria hyperparasitica]